MVKNPEKTEYDVRMLHAPNNGAGWGHGEDESLSGRTRAVLMRKETFARG